MIEKDRSTKTLFLIILGIVCISFVFNFVAYVSPFWLTTKIGEQRPFVRMGLWTVCFNGYMRPYVYDKAYYGCYYIYYTEYDRMRSWLNPVWLYAVQAISSLGIVTHVIATFIVASQRILIFSHNNLTSIATLIFLMFLTGLSLLLALIAFGVESNDSRWIEVPKYNTLSWSYAFAAISFIMVFAGFCLLVHLYMKVARIKEVEKIRRLDQRRTLYSTDSRPNAPYDPRAPPIMMPADSENGGTI